MKWLSKWIFKMTKEGSNLHQKEEANKYADEPTVANTLSSGRVNKFEQYGMNFSLYKANGGFIVEYRQYDQRTDRSDNRLHIVTDDKDLGEELSKIISYEALRS